MSTLVAYTLIISLHLPLFQSATEYTNGDITSDTTSTLYKGDTMDSYDSLVQLKLHQNPMFEGILRMYTRSSSDSLSWSSAGFETDTFQSGDHVTLQSDGEWVVFNALDEVQWTSNSMAGTAPFRLIVSDDIAVYILDSSDIVVWCSNPSLEFSALETIWYSAFNADDGLWTPDGDGVQLPSLSNHCPNAPDQCLEFEMVRFHNTNAVRTTVISMYSVIQFQVDISGYALEAGVSCQIWWRLDDSDPWTQYDTLYKNEIYRDVIVDIPLPNSYTSITIALEIPGGSGSSDTCYFDNAILRGIWTPGATSRAPTNPPTEAPTRHPTGNPTKQSTKEPTASSTPSPTNPPTESPTRHPTGNPTKQPTQYSTNKPTNKPTKSPTKSPTPSATSEPTPSPTEKPTESPTKKPWPTKNATSIDQTASIEETAESEKSDTVSTRYIVAGFAMGIGSCCLCLMVFIVCYRIKHTNEVKNVQVITSMSSQIAPPLASVSMVPVELQSANWNNVQIKMNEPGAHSAFKGHQEHDRMVTSGRHPNIAPDEFVVEGEDEVIGTGLTSEGDQGPCGHVEEVIEDDVYATAAGCNRNATNRN